MNVVDEKEVIVESSEDTSTKKVKGILRYSASDIILSGENLSHNVFPTPIPVISACFRAVPQKFVYPLPDIDFAPIQVLDPGAGDGRWGIHAQSSLVTQYPQNKVLLTGVEFRDEVSPPEFDQWYPQTDFLNWHSKDKFDYVFANPPFETQDGRAWSEFVENGLDCGTNNVLVGMFLRIQCLGGTNRYKKFYPKNYLSHVMYCVRRVAFLERLNEKTGKWQPIVDTWDYGLFLFQKNRVKDEAWTGSWWDYK